ncbi:MAG: ROK family protein [Firmicutes bacterium]|nr:ROK family protein [Bacillota bacterium]
MTGGLIIGVRCGDAFESTLWGGLDIGGSKILGIITDDSGRILGRWREPTRSPGTEGKTGIPARLLKGLGTAALSAGLSVPRPGYPTPPPAPGCLAGTGMGAPGPLDADSGMILEAPNLPEWVGIDMVTPLRTTLGCPVWLENDANLGALGESWFGAARGFQEVLYITVSTGIGGGIISGGRLIRGACGTAGEVGHMTVNMDGPICGCGNRGCLEGLASGPAIARRAEAALERDRLKTGVLATFKVGRGSLTAEDVFRAAWEGDPLALEVVEETGRYLGTGVASLLNLLNPEVVVIGGGVAAAGGLLLEPLTRHALSRAFKSATRNVKIVASELGDHSVALGAVALAQQRAGRTAPGTV